MRAAAGAVRRPRDPRARRLQGPAPRDRKKNWAGTVAGLLADLGLSSFQLDDPGRGFSFSGDGPLDMRFDPAEGVPTAAELLDTLPEGALAQLFREHGDEPHARRVARALVARRAEGRPVNTTTDLAAVVAAAVPRSRGPARVHPATRVFQALRVAVNDELRGVGDFVREAVDVLAPRGRLAVLAFHGGEDVQVKNALRDLAGRCTCPPELPRCECGRVVRVHLLTKRPARPGPEEIARNPRSRSARLRAAEKVPS